MNTTYFKNLVAGNLFRTQTSPSIPTKYYLALSRTKPSLDGTGVSEPYTTAGVNYTRIEIANLSTPIDGVVTNKTVLSFPESTGDWGTVTYYCVYDSLTGGNLLMYNKLSPSRIIEWETTLALMIGELELSIVDI